jgi:cell division topological specificity factor
VFKKLTSRFFQKNSSNKTAKNRLQMVLVQDRSGLTSQEMDFFRKDLLEVIGKYFVLERHQLDIEWHREDSCTALVINTPVMGHPRARSKSVSTEKLAATT